MFNINVSYTMQQVYPNLLQHESPETMSPVNKKIKWAIGGVAGEAINRAVGGKMGGSYIMEFNYR